MCISVIYVHPLDPKIQLSPGPAHRACQTAPQPVLFLPPSVGWQTVSEGSLYSVDWNGSLDYWNGLLEHWNGLERACHKFEFSMPTVHMHACINGKVILTMDWLLELHHYHFSYTIVFVREQCSADCDTLHGYHSRDISWSHTMSYP